MMATEEYFRRPRGGLSLAAGLFLAPLAFILNLAVTYAFATVACQDTAWLHASSLVFLALAASGGFLAWRNWRRTGGGLASDAGGALPRSRFLAIVAGMTSALFTLIILMQWVAVVLLPPCVMA